MSHPWLHVYLLTKAWPQGQLGTTGWLKQPLAGPHRKYVRAVEHKSQNIHFSGHWIFPNGMWSSSPFADVCEDNAQVAPHTSATNTKDLIFLYRNTYYNRKVCGCFCIVLIRAGSNPGWRTAFPTETKGNSDLEPFHLITIRASQSQQLHQHCTESKVLSWLLSASIWVDLKTAILFPRKARLSQAGVIASLSPGGCTQIAGES